MARERKEGKSFKAYADDAPARAPIATGGFDPGKVWDGSVGQNDVPAMQRPCLANGCPLLGTITSSVSESPNAEWFCRFHHGRRPAEFGEITRKLKMVADPHRATLAEIEAQLEREAIQAEGA